MLDSHFQNWSLILTFDRFARDRLASHRLASDRLAAIRLVRIRLASDRLAQDSSAPCSRVFSITDQINQLSLTSFEAVGP